MIAGAVGIGRADLAEKPPIGLKVINLEPSCFKRGDRVTCLSGIPVMAEWPINYCDEIVRLRDTGEYDAILISLEPEVIRTLLEREIYVILIYPDLSQKAAYQQLYRRKYPEALAEVLGNGFTQWIGTASEHRHRCCRHIVLTTGQQLKDVFLQVVNP